MNTTELPRVHAVTSDVILASQNFYDRAAMLADSQYLAIHVRGKHLDAAALTATVEGLRERIGSTALFMNDRVDLALILETSIHLPANGLPTDKVKRLVPRNIMVGRSTHSAAEARRAFEQGADYVFLGPIWPSQSHPASTGIGLDPISESLPGKIIAIGGIDSERASACVAAGAYGVAAISSLWDNPRPDRAASAIWLSLTRDKDAREHQHSR